MYSDKYREKYQPGIMYGLQNNITLMMVRASYFNVSHVNLFKFSIKI